MYLYKVYIHLLFLLVVVLKSEIKPRDAGLLWCVTQGSPLMAHRMLQKGADVNCYSEDMLSPLHIAVERYNTQMVRLLLRQPTVNVDIRDSQGNTPLHTAMDFRHLAVS